MARLPRIQVAGGLYHVTTPACANRALFRDADDWNAFKAIVAYAVARCEWTCLSYCLMTTHYHLLVRTPEENLIAGMHRINTMYAQSFNRRHAEKGHVFACRYGAELVQSDRHLFATCRYIARNPIRAGICAAAEDWRWSSYASALGLARADDFVDNAELLALFADDVAIARGRLRRFVEMADP